MIDLERADVETSSAGYARRFSGSVGRWFLRRQESCTAELLTESLQGLRVLDVGGGHGQLLPFLERAGCQVTVFGSDASCAGQIGPWLDRGAARFMSGDLLALPFDDRQFDLVLSFRLLPHVRAWRRLMAELCRVSNHRVVVDYPSSRSVNAFATPLFALKRRVERDTRRFTVFSPLEIGDAFASHQFQVVGERGQFFLPMALYRAVRSGRLGRAVEALPRGLGLTAALGSPRIVRADRMAARSEAR